jgi:hypothetical protein
MAALELLNEAFQLTADTTIQGAFFGINFSLYFLCTQLFYRQYRKASSEERRKIAFSFIYNSLMVIAAALELGAEGRFMQLAYINHGGIHGEPQQFESELSEVSVLNLLVIVPGFVIGIINPLMQVSWLVAYYFSVIG